MDQTGKAWPLTFRMGAGRPAGYVYGTIPFVATFGLNAWGVRALSLFSGLGIIILMYFLGKKLFSEKIGLLASFLTSISLWDIYLSRGGFEAHFALFLSLLGIVSFLNKKYIVWALSWGISILTYPTFKLTLPIMFLVLMWFSEYKKVIKNKLFLISIVILAIFAVVSLKETFGGLSEERFSTINVFSDVKLKASIVQKVNEQRNLSTLPNAVKLVLYNKPLSYSRVLLDNYFENLSIKFLFLRGDGNPRHNPGEWGMLYLVELPLIVVGLYKLFKKDRKTFKFLGFWILLVPLAPMFIPDSAHALRNNLFLPAFILLSAYAISNIPKKYTRIIFLAISIQFVYVLLRLYFFVPNKFGSFWSEDAKITSLEAVAMEKKGEEVVLSTKEIDNIEYAYPVYAIINPSLVINQYGKFPKTYGKVTITKD